VTGEKPYNSVRTEKARMRCADRRLGEERWLRCLGKRISRLEPRDLAIRACGDEPIGTRFRRARLGERPLAGREKRAGFDPVVAFRGRLEAELQNAESALVEVIAYDPFARILGERNRRTEALVHVRGRQLAI